MQLRIKKVIATTLIFALGVSFSACAASEDKENETAETIETSETETTTAAETMETSETETTAEVVSGAVSGLFFYGGYYYVDKGVIADEIPEGYEFVGEINNISEYAGELISTDNDLDGNTVGLVYMDPSDISVAYVEYPEGYWDEELNGRPSPIIVYQLDDKSWYHIMYP